MKDFKINRNSWHYKLNKNFMNEYGSSDNSMKSYWEPKVNNFCAYWRATIGRLTMFTFIIIALSAFLFGLVMLAVQHPIEFFGVVFGIIGIIATWVAIVYFGYKFQKVSKKMETSDSLFVTKYKSWKEKICPGVDFNG